MVPLVVFMDPRLLDSILGIIIGSAEGAFLQVTVFVGAVLLLFSYINFRSHGALIRTIQERKQWQPVIGAFLGLTPGCGGAIFIMPLYLKGSVTFGTVVATLIATPAGQRPLRTVIAGEEGQNVLRLNEVAEHEQRGVMELFGMDHLMTLSHP
ncbi:MAG: hypothetical protein IH788_05380 [Nitrospinae bacterium]|nr:hypothetical protein [Nitrospinota bacterium]